MNDNLTDIFQCSKTFVDHLSLIQHFVDHFPNIFYCFEERIKPQQTKQNPTLQQNKSTFQLPVEPKIGHQHQSPPGNAAGQNQSNEFLGQFAGLLGG